MPTGIDEYGERRRDDAITCDLGGDHRRRRRRMNAIELERIQQIEQRNAITDLPDPSAEGSPRDWVNGDSTAAAGERVLKREPASPRRRAGRAGADCRRRT
jgi:hypothetical protein